MYNYTLFYQHKNGLNVEKSGVDCLFRANYFGDFFSPPTNLISFFKKSSESFHVRN